MVGETVHFHYILGTNVPCVDDTVNITPIIRRMSYVAQVLVHDVNHSRAVGLEGI